MISKFKDEYNKVKPALESAYSKMKPIAKRVVKKIKKLPYKPGSKPEVKTLPFNPSEMPNLKPTELATGLKTRAAKAKETLQPKFERITKKYGSMKKIPKIKKYTK